MIKESIEKKINEQTLKICVIGLGYVGLPLAVQLANVGYHVLGYDKDIHKIACLKSGKNYIQDIDDEKFTQVICNRRLVVSDQENIMDDADCFIACIPTPLDTSKQPDMTYMDQAIYSIARHMHPNVLIIFESTTYPGTTEEYIRPYLEKSGLSCGKDFYLAFSPERVDPGNKQFKINNIPKIVGGVTDSCSETAAALYRHGLGVNVQTVSSTYVAEISKILENTYRYINIALIDEIARLCHRMNIDVFEVIEAAKTKPFGFHAFYPSAGVGGHCIPIDPHYLSWKAKSYDMHMTLIENSSNIIESMPHYTVERIIEILNDVGKALKTSRILLVGLAYKPNVDDMRESPSLKILAMLKKYHAHIDYYDPNILSCYCEGTKYCSVSDSAQQPELQYDLAVILVNHECNDYCFVEKVSDCIFDVANAMAGQAVSKKVMKL